MLIVVMGPPGSGKTTLSNRLSDHYDLGVVRTGRLLRREVADQTDLGKKLKKYMDAGDLAPTKLVHRVISREIGRVESERVLLIGFPRRRDQIENLHELCEQNQIELKAVVLLQLDEDEAVRRLSGRRVCTQCGRIYHVEFDPPPEGGVCGRCGGELIQRDDDQPEVVRNRFETYREQTMPVVEHFQRDLPERTFEVSAAPPPEEVADHVATHLERAGIRLTKN